jgi:deoxycytidylate deaminase
MQSVAYRITHLRITVNAVNYDHEIISGGFNDQRLFEELRDIFFRK